MKKIIFFTASFMMLSLSNLFAQSSLPLGKAQLNFGVGLSGWGIPIYLGFDYSVHKDITLGAEASFRSYNESWNKNRYRHNVIGFLGNGNYHFNSILNIPQNWDFYAGLKKVKSKSEKIQFL